MNPISSTMRDFSINEVCLSIHKIKTNEKQTKICYA